MGDQNDPTPLRPVREAVSKLWKQFSSQQHGEILGSKDSPVYPMNYGKTGICYIFNHKKFESGMELELDERSGTNVDAEQLKTLFSNLDFEVHTFNDYKVTEVMLELQKVSREKFKHYSCFVCCILTYGTDDGYLYAFNGNYPIQRIYDRFYADQCIYMSGKPKMFFIQACPSGIKNSSNQSTDNGSQVSFRIPTNADYLVVYSTVPGLYSWENSKDGSWFIEAFCSTVSEYAKDMDIFQLLSIVNYKVSLKYINANLNVEVPCVTSTLTRDIKLPVPEHQFSIESKLEKGDADDLINYEIGNSNKIGKVIIFNHKFYDDKSPTRTGTECDAEMLQRIFNERDFDVDVYPDKTKDFILETLKTVADSPHENYDCFICCILTHGDYRTLSAKDGSYERDDILSLFYDKWSGKPKIYFIQACQGKKLNPGFKMVENRKQSTDSDEVFNFCHLAHPDFLIVSSTSPGYFSFRNEKNGSWFIEELFKAFNNHAKDKEFLQLLTIANRQVANERISCCTMKERNNKKQTLCLTSTLTKNINFKCLKQNN